MWWFRRLLIAVLAIILLVSLFGLAFSSSFDSAFSSPNHLSTWAMDSNFYSSLISKASSDTATGLGSAQLYSELNPIVTQSLRSVFPKSQFNQDIDTIINSNYAWLEGKTATPNFVINVTAQKSAFANQLGSFVEKRYQSLPTCTASELASLSSANPLSIACQAPTISSSEVKSEVVNDVQSSDIIVKNPVITASSAKRSNGSPYYTAASRIPAGFRHLKTAPILLGIVSLICIAGIVFAGLKKRKTLAVLGFCFALVGLALVIISAASNKIDTKISSRIAKHSGTSSFITPIDNLVSKIVHYINGINLWFGLAYLLIAIILLAFFFMSRGRVKQSRVADNKAPAPVDPGSNQSMQPTRPAAHVQRSDPNKRRLIQ